MNQIQSISLKDPVCGMDVTENSEHHYQYAHKDYYFCCEHCLIKFKDDSEHYLQEASTEPAIEADDSSIYTCPIHPEIRQQGQ